ncbi:MAG: hypothetical protein ACRCVK_16190, partial [Aeromonas veronii]
FLTFGSVNLQLPVSRLFFSTVTITLLSTIELSTTNLVVLIIVLVRLVFGDHFDFIGQQKTRKTLNLAGFCTSSFLLGTLFGGAGGI